MTHPSVNSIVERLEPCPFCGPGNSIVECYQDDYGGWRVGCGRCGSHSGFRPKSDPDARAKVIANWNKRPAESDAEIERLRRERDEAVKREQYAIRWANASVDSVKEVVDVELADLKSERDRIARNRDMWKGQVDRQADRIRRLQPNALTAESAVAADLPSAPRI